MPSSTKKPLSAKARQALQVLTDPWRAIQRFKIVNKEGKVQQFSLNEEQVTTLEHLLEGENVLVLKPRQIGISTLVSAYLFWMALTSEEPITVAIISHKEASAKQLFKMHKQFYANLPKPLQKPLSMDNTTEMRFADSGARIIAVSAGGEGGLRSFTCNYAHISEYAFTPNPEELMATAVAALNNGQLIIESTANYYGDALYHEVNKSLRDEGDWRFLFFPWYEHSEYSTETTLTERDLTNEELLLVEDHDLSLEQIAWRRLHISKLGYDKFTREYPLSVEEAYKTVGNTLLRSVDVQHMTTVPTKAEMVLAKPNPQDRYAVGVDTSNGVGRDYSVIQVISKNTGELVYSYRHNKVAPSSFALKVQEVATLYNKALVLVESNNTGAVVINELRHLKYNNLWIDQAGNDFLTTSKTKTMIFELLRKKILAGGFSLLDTDTHTELRTIQVDHKGNIKFTSTTLESHCDNVMALALANYALESVKLDPLGQQNSIEAFLSQSRAKNIRQGTGAAPHLNRRY